MALRDKQVVFVEAYLATFNATEAARQAKYAGNDATLASVGWENLRKPEIAKAIQERLAAQVMTPDEVMNRLSEHARGDIDSFLRVLPDGETTLDISKPGANTRLIKKITQRRTIRRQKDTEVEDVVLTLELHDAQAALVQLGKHHGLFTEKIDITAHGDVLIRMDK